MLWDHACISGDGIEGTWLNVENGAAGGDPGDVVIGFATGNLAGSG